MKIAFIILLLTATILADESPKVTPEMATLKKQYEKDLELATKPVRDRYISSLQALLRSATVRGDAANIVAIQAELATLTPAVSIGPVGFWYYANPSGKGVRELRADGTFAVKQNGPAVGKWEMDNVNLTLIYPHGSDIFPLPITPHKTVGHSTGGVEVALSKTP
ncbi:MAG: hypothetical protein P4L99_02365 [Chthoniobacter sp.]|nr:hypothetical protein [Chthoniobacter sp.]